jgi:hypothetical protein
MTGKEQSRARKFLTRCLATVALLGFYCLATVGVSSVLVTTTDTSAQARGGGPRGGGAGGGGPRGGGPRGGPRGGFGRGRGGGRHFWHGRWWGYGVGPCWRLVGPIWVWICD